MKCYPIEYRNFKESYAGISYYLNGNVCLEVYSGRVRLCELSKCLQFKMPDNTVVLRDLIHTEELISEMMKADIITSYSYYRSVDEILYVCDLSEAVIKEFMNAGRVAMAGTV